MRLFHALTGTRLAVDEETAGSDAQDPATGALEIHAGDEEIRAAHCRADGVSKLFNDRLPRCLREDGHLPLATLVGVANDAAARDEAAARRGIHRAEADTLDPDVLERRHRKESVIGRNLALSEGLEPLCYVLKLSAGL